MGEFSSEACSLAAYRTPNTPPAPKTDQHNLEREIGGIASVRIRTPRRLGYRQLSMGFDA
jgi:hypothetical protein